MPCTNNIVSIGGECNDDDGFGLPDAGYGESAEIEIPTDRGQIIGLNARTAGVGAIYGFGFVLGLGDDNDKLTIKDQ